MAKIIGDMGSTHEGSMEIIKLGIRELDKAEVDYIKFQSWQSKKLNENRPNYLEELQYYQKRELTDDMHKTIVSYCKDYTIKPMFTAFDLDRMKFLKEELGMDIVKIASPDINSWDMINYAFDNFKEVLISTGMSYDFNEISRVITLASVSKARVTIMHCVSLYPTHLEDSNMRKIDMIPRGVVNAGYSDHTFGTSACIYAICHGCRYVEKHYTLSEFCEGKDSWLSASAKDFRELVTFNEDYQDMMLGYERNDAIDKMRQNYIGKWSGGNKE